MNAAAAMLLPWDIAVRLIGITLNREGCDRVRRLVGGQSTIRHPGLEPGSRFFFPIG
jgi:hypothetical protein